MLPADSRLVMPVLAAGGGSGRSTVAGLLACSLAASAATVVLDTAYRLASPWPTWPTKPGAGLASVPPDQGMTPAQVRAAASRCSGPDGDWQVLTDHQEWSAPPLPLPSDPAAWYQLAAAGGWQAVIADTAHPIAHDVVTSRTLNLSGLTAGWCALPYSVPVIAAPATGPGVAALQMAVRAASAEGLPLARMVVALVETGDGRPPAVARAAATMLQSQVSGVVQMPFDPHIRARGLGDAHRLISRKTREATAALVSAVLASAHRTWGEPLPAAPVPAGTARPGVAPPAASLLAQNDPHPQEGVLA
ncbi:hypothetical protein OG982_30075 [Streptomyces sp. NBC_01551]|uniref:hypothetical protein n=1 Tax=Streptomyces sp. NBC_01551 TaxID=2975876 RepID=UPI0022557A43|nr:hypothetical protein [Streptomyces sp. NBC_01551]MCX4529892.1 hypothetical protein [Streptomyces sp. NBC_01551]